MSEEIQKLGPLEAIRVRPEQYLGDGPSRSHPNDLLEEAMCMALAEAKCGSCSKIEVECNGLNAAITNNGMGWGTELHPSGVRFPEVILTNLYACRDHKTHQQIAHKLCSVGIVVVTALSSWLKLETVNEEGLWSMSFAWGRLDKALTLEGPVSWRGTRLSFQLEERYFPVQAFDVIALREWAKALDLPADTVVVHQT